MKSLKEKKDLQRLLRQTDNFLQKLLMGAGGALGLFIIRKAWLFHQVHQFEFDNLSDRVKTFFSSFVNFVDSLDAMVIIVALVGVLFVGGCLLGVVQKKMEGMDVFDDECS